MSGLGQTGLFRNGKYLESNAFWGRNIWFKLKDVSPGKDEYQPCKDVSLGRDKYEPCIDSKLIKFYYCKPFATYSTNIWCS